MKQHRKAYPVAMMARLLHISISRFYAWLKHVLSKRAIQRNQQTILVKIAHHETNESYSYIRLTKHLQSQAIKKWKKTYKFYASKIIFTLKNTSFILRKSSHS